MNKNLVYLLSRDQTINKYKYKLILNSCNNNNNHHPLHLDNKRIINFWLIQRQKPKQITRNKNKNKNKS
jgi:hypothetical protein